MQDFKSYSLDNKRSGRTFFKRLFLIVLALGASAIIFFSVNRKPTEEQAVLPVESAPGSTTQKPGRVTLPLPLPGKSQKEGRALPEANKPPAEPSRVISNTDQAIETTTPEPIAEAPASKIINTHQASHKIVTGDTLSKIFKNLGLSANLLHKIVHSSKSAGTLTNIKPGEILHVELDEQNSFVNLTLQHSKVHSLFIEATEDGDFNATQRTKDVELRTAHIQATIENSLYLSAQNAGLPDAVIMELANIFGWDIDFALEIRTGDRFTAIYQEEYLDGEKLRNGPILAAEFINQGRTYRAVRYEDAAGRADYFTPEGRSMRKAFLRAPVDFRRISSRFTKERWHPVLGKKRPHRGVDYAAKTGTPIRAAGDGKIVHRGKKGGYGRAVIIQHGQRYTTLYGHLSRYNKKAKHGSKVKQGQTIGYVGQSGLATGPHLHYEFRVNGVHRNPLTVKLPAAEPIAKKYRADFLLKTQMLTAQIDTLNRIVVADAR
ncbi:MAG: peptidoglycan DD-metalloendopeptidase family protein [Pseudomonadota bacterium]